MRRLIPELNYWAIQIFKNSPITEKFLDRASDISSWWRDSNSVIDLMFNETFNPVLPSSSSSSDGEIFGSQDRRYIYRYRGCNLSNIPDKNVLNRTQIYRNSIGIYAANALKFLDTFNQSGSSISTVSVADELVNDFLQGVFFDSATVTEENRSPFITYRTKIYLTSNFNLIDMRGVDLDAYPDVTDELTLLDDENIFGFIDEELDMLDQLFNFRIGDAVVLPDYNLLTSVLSRLIYIYLDAFINNSYEYYDDTSILSDGSDLLSTLFEKHVLDQIYLYRNLDYCVNHNPLEIINNELVEVKEDLFLPLSRQRTRVVLTDDDVIDGWVYIDSENTPYEPNSVTIIKNGSTIVKDQDFGIEIDVSDPTDPKFKLNLLAANFDMDEPLILYWSYLIEHSAFSQDPSTEQIENEEDVPWLG